jgi:hypothetical protein
VEEVSVWFEIYFMPLMTLIYVCEGVQRGLCTNRWHAGCMLWDGYMARWKLKHMKPMHYMANYVSHEYGHWNRDSVPTVAVQSLLVYGSGTKLEC